MMDWSVGYTIYNREDLVIPILKGVAKCFPQACEVIIHFDACTDESHQVFWKYRSVLGKRKVRVLRSSRDLFELKSNNLLIDVFTGDVLAIFQGDMICVDENICERAEKIIAEYGDSLGLLGARDGFEVVGGKRVNLTKNRWSTSKGNRIIREGEHVEKSFVNKGPIFLTRHTVNKLKGFSEDFYPGSYDDRDFCCRAKYDHDLTNVVMFSKVLEDRKASTTKLNEPLLYSLNQTKFVDKWGNRLGYLKPHGFRGCLLNHVRHVVNFASKPHPLRRMLLSHTQT